MDKRLWEHSGRANRKFIEEMTFELGCEGHRNIFQVGMRERTFQEEGQPEQRDHSRALLTHVVGCVPLCAPA